jgi:chorismate mutase
VRAVRGAITVDEDSVPAIHAATQQLLSEIASRNELGVEEVVSIFFSVTADLTADFPARAARAMGWDVPMLDTQEMHVPGSLGKCLRVLVQVNRDGELRPAYLKAAAQLRPDLEAGY